MKIKFRDSFIRASTSPLRYTEAKVLCICTKGELRRPDKNYPCICYVYAIYPRQKYCAKAEINGIISIKIVKFKINYI